jgi:hypothetical protein
VNRLGSVSLFLGLTTIAACGDSTGPGDVAGTYEATTFTLTRTGAPPANVRSAGGTMTLILVEDGRMSGNVFIPPSLTGNPEQQFEIILGGTFTVSDGRVLLRPSEDPDFREQIALAVGANTLSGSFNALDGTVEITLTRTETP